MHCNHNHPRKGTRGFSLTEALVATGVAAVLTSIALSVLPDFSEKGKIIAIERNAESMNHVLRTAARAGAEGIPTGTDPSAYISALKSGSIFVDVDSDGVKGANETVFAMKGDLRNLEHATIPGISVKVVETDGRPTQFQVVRESETTAY
jgi:type II secretory pathway pseudopilin PulG